MRSSFSIFVLFLLLSACNSQRVTMKEMQDFYSTVRTVEKIPYDAVFQGTVKTLRTEGYMVQLADEKKGTIVGVFQQDHLNAFWKILANTRSSQRGEVFELSINVDRVSDKVTRLRYSLQRTAPYTFGGHEGEEVLDPSVYQTFHTQVLKTLGIIPNPKEATPPVPATKPG